MFVKKFVFLVLSVLILGGVTVAAGPKSIAETTPENWFAPNTPVVTKVHDYSLDNRPLASNLDCQTKVVGTLQRCTVDTNIGTIATAGTMVVGNNETNLTGYQGFGYLISVPGTSMFLDIRPGATTGMYATIHRNLQRSDVVLKSYWGYPVRWQYETDQPFDFWLTDSTKNRLEINPQTLAFSSNGYWMAVDVPHAGIFKINMATMDIFPAGLSAEGPMDNGLRTAPVAISDDGRYVAIGKGANLTISDTSTCTYQGYDGGSVNLAGCRYRDLWAGQTGTQDAGLESKINSGMVLGNLRFVDDGNIRFDAYYDYVKYSDTKIAQYVVTAEGAATHKLGLLGMGDSYISGEGEFEYLAGTDESGLNMCHLSPKSYPYLLGGESFDDYHSVACSGAKSNDVTDGNNEYIGQAHDGIQQKNRDMASILSLFSPGYIYQGAFAKNYQPKVILLSIGGNDVGFSKILTSCISGITDNSTCYATREEREQLLDSINNEFSTLVSTYQKIQNEAPGSRIYVVGYPQAVRPDGDCGDNVRLNASETEFATQLTSHLDAVIARAAAAKGIFYVDTTYALDGYRLCEAGPSAAAVNGVTVGTDEGPKFFGKKVKLVSNETYHPTVLGHQLLADAIAVQTDHLTAAMPVAQPNLIQPQTDPDDPFLANLPSTGQNLFERVADVSMTSTDYIIEGAATKLNLSGLADNLASNSLFDVVLHSDPIDLGDVTSNANGDIAATITIPNTVEPGMHTLHVYGKDISGKSIDVQKIIYVISVDGSVYDGYCQIVPDSGKDVDADGIDDACDPVIGVASAPRATPVSVSNSGADEPESLPMAEPALVQKDYSSVPKIAPLQSAPNMAQLVLRFTHVGTDMTTSSAVGGKNIEISPKDQASVLGAATIEVQKTPTKRRFTNKAVVVAAGVASVGVITTCGWLWKRRS